MLRKEGFEVALAETGPAALEEFRATPGVRSRAARPHAARGCSGNRGLPPHLAVRSAVPVITATAKDGRVDQVVDTSELEPATTSDKPYSARATRRSGSGAVPLRPHEKAENEVVTATMESDPVAARRRSSCRQCRRQAGDHAAQGVRAARDAAAQLRQGVHPWPSFHRSACGASGYVRRHRRPWMCTSAAARQGRADLGAPQHIVTVRGLGYKFEP